ncbi:DAK2 domain-containing protein [Paenibacillus thermoaerophilus]|uniref:DAK2 domain-containing protein n=1 Tax=Paenibacillus thermoaerophilus TaxID=1215385 RepID=A0ABW2UZT6_9BACL|nr:DAK2 domain-containing protein [Paenibacillus thermoaerophilus]TMV19160.1 DAK2 domain-containing protein [Paenibacillus thermoaerophilus]
MSKRLISGTDFIQMVLRASSALTSRVKEVNALNVFPVPDGDTGTNMNMTWNSGVEELKKRSSEHLGKCAEALAKGLMLGARGNSGVILSQLFRGFSKAVAELAEANAQQLAAALQQGVDTAYKAVMKPVEGTILTVARETAKHAVSSARWKPDLGEFFQEVVSKAREALSRTPDLLPVLKQVGVVDAGGRGLVILYEAFQETLTDAGEWTAPPMEAYVVADEAPASADAGGHAPAQAHLATEEIKFGYCTEFMVRLTPVPGAPGNRRPFREAEFRSRLSEFGDSLLVVADEEFVKVHVHAEEPGKVLSLGLEYGALDRIKIENMRLQHTHLLDEANREAAAAVRTAAQPDTAPQAARKRFGIVAVSVGSGLKDIFSSVGVDVVLSGGQTMNPSTEDIVQAARKTGAETVFVLPNNSNIIMAARQAAELLDDQRLVVVPTRTIPQGMAALVVFNPEESAEFNAEEMARAAAGVRSGQVTKAVRDTELDGLTVREGAYIGIADSKLVAAEDDLIVCCLKLVSRMLDDDREILTVLTGEDADPATTERLIAAITEEHPDVELELHDGGQPLYPYLFAAE